MQTQIAPFFPGRSPAPAQTGSGTAIDVAEPGAFSAHLPKRDSEGLQEDAAQILPANGEASAAPVPPPWADLRAGLAALRVESAGEEAMSGFAPADLDGIVTGTDINRDRHVPQTGQTALDAGDRSASPPELSGLGPTLPSAKAEGAASLVPAGGPVVADGVPVSRIAALEPAVSLQPGLQGRLQGEPGASDPALAIGLAAAAQDHVSQWGSDRRGWHSNGNSRHWQGTFSGENGSGARDGPTNQSDRAVPAGNAASSLADLMGNAFAPSANGQELAQAGGVTVPDMVYGDAPRGEFGLLSGPGVGSASGLGAVAGAPSASAQPPVPQLAARLVETLVHSGNGVTEISLSPDELGQVRVLLQADAQNPDRMVVMLNFDRQETLDLFRRHADQLAEALMAAGYSGVDIGFGQSGTGHGNGSDTPPTASTEPVLADVIALDPAAHPLRLAASHSLDLRL